MEDSKFTRIAVVGLGYVGLPLAFLFLQKGFEVTGIDLDNKKIEWLKAGKSYLTDLTDDEVAQAAGTGRFRVSNRMEEITAADAIVLCVPTPLRNDEPDLSYVYSAAQAMKPHCRKGQLIVLESTTYPGTTAEVLAPLFSSEQLQVGKDLFLAYSPERISPGSHVPLNEIPKVVSGYTDACKQRITEFYGQVFQTIVPVSSTSAAEMVKILENCYRLINISFMNELSVLCRRQGINIWEVIDAAATKPYGFTPFFPGPGIGGHCIPVDPLYLKWKANQLGLNTKMIDVAHEINRKRPLQIVEFLSTVLGADDYKGKQIFVLGVAYKKDINDLRESPAIAVLEGLLEKKAAVAYCDPYIPKLALSANTLTSVPLGTDEFTRHVQSADCVLILTNHSIFDYKTIVQEARFVVDTRNATKGTSNSANVIFV